MRVAPLVDPVVVKPGHYLTPGKLDRIVEPVLINSALKFGDVGPYEILAGKTDSVAIGDHVLLAVRTEAPP